MRREERGGTNGFLSSSRDVECLPVQEVSTEVVDRDAPILEDLIPIVSVQFTCGGGRD
jgi:hypothetical protein